MATARTSDSSAKWLRDSSGGPRSSAASGTSGKRNSDQTVEMSRFVRQIVYGGNETNRVTSSGGAEMSPVQYRVPRPSTLESKTNTETTHLPGSPRGLRSASRRPPTGNRGLSAKSLSGAPPLRAGSLHSALLRSGSAVSGRSSARATSASTPQVDPLTNSLSLSNPVAPPPQPSLSSSSDSAVLKPSGTPRQRKPATPVNTGPNMNMITIHVLDENRKVRKDFRCPRHVLVREMRYFEACLSDVAKIDGIDISVHCDVKIFDWLMKYVKAKVSTTGIRGDSPSDRASLSVKNVVSILVSSEFLKMDGLVEQCLDFCRGNINAIIQSPSNIACLTSRLLTRLASQFSFAELRHIVDDTDKIKSKIYWFRLVQLFSEGSPGRQLFRCANCERVLLQTHALQTPCISQGHVSNDNSVRYVHTPDLAWDAHAFLLEHHRNGVSAVALFWHVIELLHYFRCRRCEAWFPYNERDSCRRCTQIPAAVAGVNAGPASGADFINDGAAVAMVAYGCCGRRVPRFHIDLVKGGCTAGPHDVDPTETGSSDVITLEDLDTYPNALRNTTGLAEPRQPNLFWEEERASEPPLRAERVSTLPLSPTAESSFDGEIVGEDCDAEKRPTTPRKQIARKTSKALVPYVAPREQLVHDNSYIAFGVRVQPPTQKQIGESPMYKHAIDRVRASDVARTSELCNALVQNRAEPAGNKNPRGAVSGGPLTSVEARMAEVEQLFNERRKKEAEAEKKLRSSRTKGARPAPPP